jgi:hypothetical protein
VLRHRGRGNIVRMRVPLTASTTATRAGALTTRLPRRPSSSIWLHSHSLANGRTGLLTGQLREPMEQALAFTRQRGL